MVEIVSFPLIGYQDGTNNNWRSQRLLKGFPRVAYKYGAYTKKGSRSGQVGHQMKMLNECHAKHVFRAIMQGPWGQLWNRGGTAPTPQLSFKNLTPFVIVTPSITVCYKDISQQLQNISFQWPELVDFRTSLIISVLLGPFLYWQLSHIRWSNYHFGCKNNVASCPVQD